MDAWVSIEINELMQGQEMLTDEHIAVVVRLLLITKRIDPHEILERISDDVDPSDANRYAERLYRLFYAYTIERIDMDDDALENWMCEFVRTYYLLNDKKVWYDTMHEFVCYANTQEPTERFRIMLESNLSCVYAVKALGSGSNSSTVEELLTYLCVQVGANINEAYVPDIEDEYREDEVCLVCWVLHGMIRNSTCDVDEAIWMLMRLGMKRSIHNGCECEICANDDDGPLDPTPLAYVDALAAHAARFAPCLAYITLNPARGNDFKVAIDELFPC